MCPYIYAYVWLHLWNKHTFVSVCWWPRTASCCWLNTTCSHTHSCVTALPLACSSTLLISRQGCTGSIDPAARGESGWWIPHGYQIDPRSVYHWPLKAAWLLLANWKKKVLTDGNNNIPQRAFFSVIMGTSGLAGQTFEQKNNKLTLHTAHKACNTPIQ